MGEDQSVEQRCSMGREADVRRQCDITDLQCVSGRSGAGRLAYLTGGVFLRL
jgi:hypothetical protein